MEREIKTALSYGHTPNKKYGQNFLKDEFVLDKIIQSMSNDDKSIEICEIGPGLGDLTIKLLELFRVTAFEVDKNLYSILKKRFEKEIDSSRFILKNVDILDEWRENSLLFAPYKMVANLPYYIATNIILKALKDDNCKELLVMVQKEVAQKFCAKCGDRDFGALAILSSSIGEAKIVIDVPPSSFYPEPKVDSAVMKIVKKENLEFDEFSRFLRVAFSAPRKKLYKNLQTLYQKDRVSLAFATFCIEESSRAHEIPTPLYHQLFQILRDT